MLRFAAHGAKTLSDCFAASDHFLRQQFAEYRLAATSLNLVTRKSLNFALIERRIS